MNTQPKKGQIFVYFNTTASLAQAENYYFYTTAIHINYLIFSYNTFVNSKGEHYMLLNTSH